MRQCLEIPGREALLECHILLSPFRPSLTWTMCLSLSPVGEDVPALPSILAQALFPHCHPLAPHLGSALSLPLENQPEAIAAA